MSTRHTPDQHAFQPRPWGIECKCGQYVDFGRPGTDAECEYENQARAEGFKLWQLLHKRHVEEQATPTV